MPGFLFDKVFELVEKPVDSNKFCCDTVHFDKLNVQ